MRTVSPLIAALVAMIPAASPANAFEMATSYKATEVAPGLHMIEGADGFGGGNVGLLVGPEKVILIDDAMEPTAPALIRVAEEIAGRTPDFVINTHVHGDHVGGNALLAHSGALIFSHDNIRKRLATDPKEAGGEAGLPVVTFSEEVTFHVNGTEVRVFHIPSAHTDGDGAIHFPGMNVIHAGDVVFRGMFPYIDLDNGGSVAGFIEGQRRLIAMSDENTVIIPGHGPLATRDDVQREVDVLVDCRDKVRALVEKGLSADEIVEANPLAEYHDGWNWDFITTERMTRTLVRDLAG